MFNTLNKISLQDVHPDMQVKTLTIDGLEMVYSVGGQGPPIVLIHGLGLSIREWEKNLDTLLEHGRVYALDLPGFGASEDPREVWGTRMLAEKALRWAKALELPPAVWIGHSLGGEICLWAACLQSECVKSLVLAASMGLPPRPSLAKRGMGLLVDGLMEPPHFMWRLYLAYLQAGLWRVLRTIQKSGTTELLHEVGKLDMPVLVVNGRYDPVVSLSEGRMLARRLKKGEFKVVKAAHGIVFGNADAFNDCCASFLLKNL